LDLDTLRGTQLSIGRRFAPQSRVRFLLNVYNSAASGILMQTRIYRGNQLVSQSQSKALRVAASNANDGTIFFSDDLPLKDLPPGAYTLEATATDRSKNTTATQRVAFWIK
jgi:hypothetical protein